nr:glycerate kinase [Microbacterium rhizomatis]
MRTQTRTGAEPVLDLLGIDGLPREADPVVTGEGSPDAQTLSGMAPAEVARRAHLRRLPVFAVGGIAEPASGRSLASSPRSTNCMP